MPSVSGNFLISDNILWAITDVVALQTQTNYTQECDIRIHETIRTEKKQQKCFSHTWIWRAKANKIQG